MTKKIKFKTGREIRADTASVLATFAKHVRTTTKKKPVAAAKHTDRGRRLRAAEASVRTAKSEPVARPASRSALAGHAEAAKKQKIATATFAIRNRYNDLRR